MKDIDLSALSPRTFQQLVQALAIQELGHLLVPLGDGADGARDAIYQGRITNLSNKQPWDGYLVIQVKHRQNPSNNPTDAARLCTQLRSDLSKLANQADHTLRPDYYIIATNLKLSPVPDTEVKIKSGAKGRRIGGRARVEAVIKESKTAHRVPFKDFDIWDHTKIIGMLGAYPGIRTTFLGEFTSGDILNRLWVSLERNDPDLAVVLPRFIQAELQADVDIPLERAGHHTGPGHRQVRLSEVFMDLPLSIHVRQQPTEHVRAVSFFCSLDQHSSAHKLGESYDVVDADDPSKELSMHEDSLNLEESRDMLRSRTPRRSQQFVLVGGPGQGKTTVGRFLAQIYRSVALLQIKDAEINRTVMDIIGELRLRCIEDNVAFPELIRLPLRVELATFAKDLADGKCSSLLEYFTLRIKMRTGDSLSSVTLRNGLQRHRWIVILDGLDEVPVTSNRSNVIEAISDFISSAGVETDIRVLVTTRPQGYGQALDPRHYRHMQLAPLTPDDGARYAERLIRIRYADAQKQATITQLLKKAASDPATGHLMGTPLHVTIMIALLEQGGLLPKDRWRLFERYYEVIYTREQGASNSNSSILQENKDLIDNIHRYAGLILHINSESAGGTDARISRHHLHLLVEHLLLAEFGKSSAPAGLRIKVLRIATDRLVFLAGDESAKTIGFDVASLREYMAAMALFVGDDNQVLGRLRHIIPLPHWRNVALLLVGKCFSQVQRFREPIVKLCHQINQIPLELKQVTFDEAMLVAQCGACLKVGSRFSLDLLEEQIAVHADFRAQLIKIAFELFDETIRPNQPRIAQLLGAIYRLELRPLYETELVTRLTNYTREKFSHCERGTELAWRVLLTLIDLHIDWAIRLGDHFLPRDPLPAFQILRLAPDQGLRCRWVIAHYEQLGGRVVPVLRRYRGADVDSLLEEKVISHPALRLLFVVGMPMLRIRVGLGDPNSTHVTLRVRPIFEEGEWIKPFGREDTSHLIWFFQAAKFQQHPSQETLAELLNRYSVAFDDGGRPPSWLLHSWIVAACLEYARRSGEEREIAQRLRDVAVEVERGLWGSTEDWKALENRWLIQGIDFDELLKWARFSEPNAEVIRDGILPLLHIALPTPPRRPSFVVSKFIERLAALPPGLERSALAMFVVSNYARRTLGVPDHQPRPFTLDCTTAKILVNDGVRLGARLQYGFFALLSDVDEVAWDDKEFIRLLNSVMARSTSRGVPFITMQLIGRFATILTSMPELWGFAKTIAVNVARLGDLVPTISCALAKLSPRNESEQAIVAVLRIGVQHQEKNDLTDWIDCAFQGGFVEPIIDIVSDRGLLPGRQGRWPIELRRKTLSVLINKVFFCKDVLLQDYRDQVVFAMQNFLEASRSKFGEVKLSDGLGLPEGVCDLIASVCAEDSNGAECEILF